MQLTGQRIKLLPFDSTDRDLFIENSMCPKMMEHVYDPLSYSEAEEAFAIKSRPWVAEGDSWLSLGITALSTGDKLGNIGLKVVNHQAKIAEVGFMIKPTAQGQGFAAEALALLIAYAHSELKLNKLVATCSVNNVGSYRLLEKVGFIREGCLQHNAIINNKYIDDYVYGLCMPFAN